MQLTSVDLRRHYVTTNWNAYIRGTTRIHRFNRYKKDLWVAGPDEDWLRKNRITARRDRLDLREVGRYDRDQYKEAERKVRDHAASTRSASAARSRSVASARRSCAGTKRSAAASRGAPPVRRRAQPPRGGAEAPRRAPPPQRGGAAQGAG